MGGAPPGAVYRFAPDWKEKHVLSHLADARGILQAPSRGLKSNHCRAVDSYKGYARLCKPEADGTGRLREVVCWAHLRRDFHDFWASTKSEIAGEALDRIGKLYDIERDINRFGLSFGSGPTSSTEGATRAVAVSSSSRS